MEKHEIYLGDIKRILIGNAPPEFLLEVVMRTLITYLFVLVIVRLLGKRLSGQITLAEMAVLIMLGAIIGSPIQIPDRGILTAFIILCCTLLLQLFMNIWSFRTPRFETLTQGSSSLLVKDGVIQTEQLSKERVSTQQLFAILREQGISQLGEVKRVYLEACGAFSVYKSVVTRPGLPVFPTRDNGLLDEMHHVPELKVCIVCGTTADLAQQACLHCGSKKFTPAFVS